MRAKSKDVLSSSLTKGLLSYSTIAFETKNALA